MDHNCRLCLTHESEVYSEMDTVNYLQQLKSIIPEIDINLTVSPLICTKCSELLLNAYIFKLNCLKSEEQLKLSLNGLQDKTKYELPESKIECSHENIDDVDNISVDQTEYVVECPKEEPNILQNNSTSQKDIIEYPLKESTKNNFLCKFCGLKLATYRQWHDHIKVHTASSNNCDICSKSFETRPQLLSHRDTHRINKCLFCGQEFLYKSTFSKHVREQHVDEMHPEHIAHNSFARTVGRYECSICGVKTKEKCQLIEHIRKHTGERPYKCTVCNKAFAQSSTLSTHTKSMHTTDRPFQCEICGKGYAVKGTYTVHMKTHENLPKNFVCHHCGKAYTLQGRLKEHMRRHIADKRIVCHVCSKSFVDLNGLKKHMRIHTGEKPFECTICHKKFTQQYNMRIHLKSCARRNRCIKPEQKITVLNS